MYIQEIIVETLVETFIAPLPTLSIFLVYLLLPANFIGSNTFRFSR